RNLVDSLRESGGRLAVLMTPTRSPSLVRMVTQLRDQLPETAVCVYDSVHGDALARGIEAATGEAARPVYRLDQADVILSLEADILGSHPGFLQNVRGFAQGRNPTEGTMNRL